MSFTTALNDPSDDDLPDTTRPAGPYCTHFRTAGGSPRGYAGPAICQRLLFDIDRKGDLSAALTDARTLVRFVNNRYGTKVEDGVSAFFSGAKGFHVSLDCLPGYGADGRVPAITKRMALGIAAAAGVTIDPACYDHQRLVRLPNSRHPATGLYKRALTAHDLFSLDVTGIQKLARHPAGFDVPVCGEYIPRLDDESVVVLELAVRVDERRRQR